MWLAIKPTGPRDTGTPHREIKFPISELEIVGSHGMQAYRFPALFGMIAAGRLDPGRLVQRTVTLGESLDELVDMGRFAGTGITIPQAGNICDG